MQWVTLCSCLKQVMESLLLVSGCLECVGGVWHKQGFQLTEPGTDGAGKWGTSQKHWNPLQRPSPHLSLSCMHTLFFPPVLSFLHKWTFFFAKIIYEHLLLLMQVSFVLNDTQAHSKKEQICWGWECLTLFLLHGNMGCFGSSASMSFYSPGWNQQMAGLGLGLSREIQQKAKEKCWIVEALTSCTPFIHHR